MKKKQLTLEQHYEIGLKLAQMRDELVRLQSLVANAYPLSSRGGKASIKLTKATRTVDEVRSLLDDASAGEIPGPAWSPRIYYPRQEDRRA